MVPEEVDVPAWDVNSGGHHPVDTTGSDDGCCRAEACDDSFWIEAVASFQVGAGRILPSAEREVRKVEAEWFPAESGPVKGHRPRTRGTEVAEAEVSVSQERREFRQDLVIVRAVTPELHRPLICIDRRPIKRAHLEAPAQLVPTDPGTVPAPVVDLPGREVGGCSINRCRFARNVLQVDLVPHHSVALRRPQIRTIRQDP